MAQLFQKMNQQNEPLITPLPEVRLDNVKSDEATHPMAQNLMVESSVIIQHRFIKKKFFNCNASTCCCISMSAFACSMGIAYCS